MRSEGDPGPRPRDHAVGAAGVLQAQLSPHLQSGPQAQVAVWQAHGSQAQGSQGQLAGIGSLLGWEFSHGET